MLEITWLPIAYNHDSTPKEDNESKELARSDFTDHDSRRWLEQSIRKEEHKRHDGVRVVLIVHVELGLHSRELSVINRCVIRETVLPSNYTKSAF
jgi:hypothetical protein